MQSALLTCPHCKEQGEQQLTPFLDLGKHPKQKLAILTDSLFTLTCPSCKQQYSVLHELLVVDEKQHYAFMLIPDTELGEVDGKVTGKEEFDEYLLRLVGSSAGLKEKLLLLDNNLDDRVIELCKLYLSMQLEQQDVQLFFADQQKEEQTLLFTVMDAESHVLGSVECERELYTQLTETVKAFAVRKGYFTKVDQAWAYQQIRNSADQ
ncbi:MAG: CpXC domain-containing protein [Sphaerochaeta sp.]|uniref:CpXC domain-containing protein n=1 Tax=Sphaerochaeta sp. TaxID=1972642 RepID=UPI0029744CE5|nr:CpXC domain-containing protein [uncultured Sphaerochaeta sp.]MDD3057382.1 CpXC domain-containing protein [Sphaerochaeta sp.]MDD3928553.1 CpXC domain-containing protein [Sphaerochaeta sp.]